MKDNSEGSEPIKLTDEQRIKKEANEYILKNIPDEDTSAFYDGKYNAYIAGANAERERLTKEIEKLKSKIAVLQSGVEQGEAKRRYVE